MKLFTSIWNLFSGAKTYLAGAALLLVGLGALFTAVGHCIDDVQTIENGMDICTQDISAAWGAVMAGLVGLGIIGARHAISKASRGEA